MDKPKIEQADPTNQKMFTEQTSQNSSIIADRSGSREIQVDKQVTSSEAENKSTDADSRGESKRSDKDVEHERSPVDQAIAEALDEKRDVLGQLLVEARAQTEHNLYQERDRIDSEVKRVSRLLSDEVASHLKTKISLTTRDEFLAIVSHDLRNPIGAIYSCSEMLLEDLASEGASESKYWLEFIKRNAASALHLINDILDIERISKGKLGLLFGRYSIARLIRESIENFVYEASAKNVLLRSKQTKDIFSAVCDHDRIIQVLSNLIGNALKFTSSGGSVVLDAYKKGDQVLISVTDSGPGIPEDKKKTIFERFAQIGLADRKGLGLGLYISKMLIEAHQGEIWVESELGKGSTFWISIPEKGPTGHLNVH